MGTNYYWIMDPPPACSTCNRRDPEGKLHIGKASAGWAFALHVWTYDDIEPVLVTQPRDLDGWLTLFGLEGSRIVDEHGQEMTVDEMIGVITVRTWQGGPPANRAAFDGVRCVGYGNGPWDLITGEFS